MGVKSGSGTRTSLTRRRRTIVIYYFFLKLYYWILYTINFKYMIQNNTYEHHNPIKKMLENKQPQNMHHQGT